MRQTAFNKFFALLTTLVFAPAATWAACLPREDMVKYDSFIILRVETDQKRILKEGSIVAAYPPGLYPANFVEALKGRRCLAKDGFISIYALSKSGYKISPQVQPIYDALRAAINSGELEVANQQFALARQLYEVGKLNVLEAAYFFALGAPVQRARREFAAGATSAQNALLLKGLITNPEMRDVMAYEAILSQVGMGDHGAALHTFDKMQKESKRPPPKPLVDLMDRLRATGITQSYFFDDPNIGRTIASLR